MQPTGFFHDAEGEIPGVSIEELHTAGCDAVRKSIYKGYPIYRVKNAEVFHTQGEYDTIYPVIVIYADKRKNYIKEYYNEAYWNPAGKPIPYSYNKNTINKIKKLHKIAPISCHAYFGFWHTIMELAPRIVYLELCGFDGQYILPEAHDRRLVLNLFEYFEIADNRLVFTDDMIQCDECYIAPSVWHCELNDVSLLSITRKFFINKLRYSPPLLSNKNIYVIRNGSRRCVNEDEISRILMKYNFKIIDMDTLSLSEQIRTAMSAKVLMGPHGAGMVHCMFMKPHSTVIEMFSSRMTQTCILNIIQELSLNYYMAVERVPPVYDEESDAGHADMKASPWLLSRILRNATIYKVSFVRRAAYALHRFLKRNAKESPMLRRIGDYSKKIIGKTSP